MDGVNFLEKRPVEIFSLDFGQHGTLFNMTNTGKDTGNVQRWSGMDWQDANTSIPLIDTLGYLGYTLGNGLPATIVEMERHLHTQEALFPTDQPIVFVIAPASETAPSVMDVIPVILRPGYVFVLHRGTWHSSAYGIKEEVYYHYLALVYHNEPTTISPIVGGPLRVELF